MVMARILIVEDSRTQAEQLKYVLEDARYRVSVAADAAEATALFEAEEFDLVISDIVMPGQSGYDLCRTLKADRRRDVPVILLSSLSDPMDIIRGLECGADNFLTKPYNLELLLARVGAVIQNRKLRHESKVKLGVDVYFLGQSFTITSDKEQILDLLISTFEDIVRTNNQLRESQVELAEAKAQIEGHARRLEKEVQQRTADLARANKSLEGEIADRSRIAESLRESNALLSAIITASPLPIYVLDLEGKVRLWNTAAEKAFGCTTEEVVGKIPPFVTDHAFKAFYRDFVQAATRAELAGKDFTGRQGDGKSIELSISGAPLKDEQGNLNSIMHVVVDMTERKIVERQLIHAQKMEAVGQLTGGVAHDFNNLLSVVIGNLDFLNDLVQKTPGASELIDIAMQACERGAALTSQMLAFSRRQPLNPQLIDISEVVGGIAGLLSSALGENIETRLIKNQEPCLAMADLAQVEAAIMNLAVNASHAMSGGGMLTIETKQLQLDNSFSAMDQGVSPGNYILLEVTDTGSGIPPEVLERVFEPFFTTKAEGKGSGLGLSQVLGFVQQSGGNVKIYSEVGVGTTVRVYFPQAIEPSMPGQSHAPVSGEDIQRGSESILVVEDNAAVRQTLLLQLGGLGYEVLEAKNADEALTILGADRKIDLLFTDVVMPGTMSGLELAKLATKRYPEMKILVSSGFPGAAIARTPDVVTAHFFNKPYRYRDLAAKIREVLGTDR